MKINLSNPKNNHYISEKEVISAVAILSHINKSRNIALGIKSTSGFLRLTNLVTISNLQKAPILI
jgi:hypothetical protein